MRVLMSVLAAILAVGCAATQPELEFGADTPGDLQVLAASTFAGMVEAFPARAGCLDGVTVEGAWELEHRAQYQPDTATVTVRIPATAPQLEVSLVHELAHHLEMGCESHLAERPALAASMGFDPAADWFAGETRDDTPSERFAAAVVRFVLDRRDFGTSAAVSEDTLALIGEWATG